ARPRGGPYRHGEVREMGRPGKQSRVRSRARLRAGPDLCRGRARRLRPRARTGPRAARSAARAFPPLRVGEGLRPGLDPWLNARLARAPFLSTLTFIARSRRPRPNARPAVGPRARTPHPA